MSTERIIGVDFGTSTSVMRVKRYDVAGGSKNPLPDKLTTMSVTFNMGSTMLPTLIQKTEKNTTLYGYDAQVPHRNSSLYQNFKIKIESEDNKEKQEARKLTEEFFKYMADSYKAQSLGGHLGQNNDPEKTLISYPVKWSEETKQFMLETAEKAGFKNVEGIDEAQAAIHAALIQNEEALSRNGYLQSGNPVNIMLIDMGAGTTDIVIDKYTPGKEATIEVLCTWPKGGDVLFGGREVDELLSDYIRSKLPDNVADRVFTQLGTDKFKEWKDTLVSPALQQGERVDSFAALDNILFFLGIDDVNYSFNRADFECFAEEYLKKFPQLVQGSLQEAKLSGNDIDLVVLTGGHSQWYFVKNLLTDAKPDLGECGLGKIKENADRIISITLPQETVALGMAYNGIEMKYIEKPSTEVSEEPVLVIEEKKLSESGRTAVFGTVLCDSIEVGQKVKWKNYIDNATVGFHSQINGIVEWHEPYGELKEAKKGEKVALWLNGADLNFIKVGGMLLKGSSPDNYITCKNCGAENNSNHVFCEICGKRIDGETPHQPPKNCKTCGNKIKENYKFCEVCGTPVGGGEPPKPLTLNERYYEQIVQYERENGQIGYNWDKGNFLYNTNGVRICAKTHIFSANEFIELTWDEFIDEKFGADNISNMIYKGMKIQLSNATLPTINTLQQKLKEIRKKHNV